jgi:hypothetical protein
MAKQLSDVLNRTDVLELQSVLDDLAVGQKWDVLLVGDGSGTARHKPCGWSCALLSRLPMFSRIFFGFRNTGGVPFAELQTYLQALEWHWFEHGQASLRSRLRTDPVARLHTHILCDNFVTVEQGKTVNLGDKAMKRDNQRFQWAAIDEFVACGYALNWHWRPRNNNQLNRLCDRLAGICRKTAIAVENENLDAAAAVSLYDYPHRSGNVPIDPPGQRTTSGEEPNPPA